MNFCACFIYTSLSRKHNSASLKSKKISASSCRNWYEYAT